MALIAIIAPLIICFCIAYVLGTTDRGKNILIVIMSAIILLPTLCVVLSSDRAEDGQLGKRLAALENRMKDVNPDYKPWHPHSFNARDFLDSPAVIFLIPVIAFLCVGIVQALRGKWKNMVISILSATIFLQLSLVTFFGKQTSRRERVEWLERSLHNIESNNTSDGIRQPASGSPKPSM